MVIQNINLAWVNILREIQAYGKPVSPRGLPVKELLCFQSTIDMKHPKLEVPRRNLGNKFLHAEAAWILSGDNRVSSIKPYSVQISKFSDDGIRFFGSYGPKFIDQIRYVSETLNRDEDSRQAVINIWRENPPITKDVPCTLSVQFIIRDGKINVIDTMRSSDTWLGWPYDMFNFTMMAGYLALYLKKAYNKTYDLGWITLNAGSQHTYERDDENIKIVLDDASSYANSKWEFNPHVFDDPEDLVEALWSTME